MLILVLLFTCSWLSGQENTALLLQKTNASELQFDTTNEDAVFIAKNKLTNKWGMYQGYANHDIKELIPPAYDSIDFFGYNAKLTGVWLDGKVGLYTSPWTYGSKKAKQTVECLYDGYKIFQVEKTVNDGLSTYQSYVDYVAVKKEGLWAWIDWMTGELKTDFLYNLDKEQMPYPEFEQEN